MAETFVIADTVFNLEEYLVYGELGQTGFSREKAKEILEDIREDVLTAMTHTDKTTREASIQELKRVYHGFIRRAYTIDDQIYLEVNLRGPKPGTAILCDLPDYFSKNRRDVFPFKI